MALSAAFAGKARSSHAIYRPCDSLPLPRGIATLSDMDAVATDQPYGTGWVRGGGGKKAEIASEGEYTLHVQTALVQPQTRYNPGARSRGNYRSDEPNFDLDSVAA